MAREPHWFRVRWYDVVATLGIGVAAMFAPHICIGLLTAQALVGVLRNLVEDSRGA